MSAPATNLVTINVDGRDYQVPAGMNLIDALELFGLEIPHYCYHPKLTVAGNCRMCLVETGMPMRDRTTNQFIIEPDGRMKIGWGPKPAVACTTNCTAGLHVRTNTPVVKDCREGVMEFLLVNHPLDCPICDQAGECKLQEFATDYGRGYSRFIEEKNVKPKRTRLGPRVTLDDERCILCSRCVRFCAEIAKDPVLGFIERGSYSTLTCYPGRELDNNYSLNTVDICPVGALTSTDFRFKMRVWFLKPVPSICTESSVGANTEVWSREGKIYRITPRENNAVNDCWMSDSGRELYKQVESPLRIDYFAVNNGKCAPDQALARAAELLKGGGVGYVGSAQSSLEEQFLLGQLVKAAPGPVAFVKHAGKGDGLLISNDATPNLRGAFLTGLVRELPKANLDELRQKVESGAIQTLFVVHEDLAALGFSDALLRRVKIIYLGTHTNLMSEHAQVVLPGLTVFEKSGSFVNQQWRVQRFFQAVPGPAGTAPDIQVLGQLLARVQGESAGGFSPEAIWPQISTVIAPLAGWTWESLGLQGRVLDASSWAHVPFPEGKSLRFDPAAVTAVKAG
ncbi:MAG TPA: 2Fe-2S iron-sulfur cluster-binding protein [Opitutales bacterium]|nr:2Fe-2S iron-sulfur cluster-binding protein [Opitutales bacterium]